jgi:lipopolysaccharide export system permease protein
VGLGILRRYVLGQVLRSFALALLAITAIFVLLMVMVEATRKGLTPRDVAELVPFIIPGTLPFTIPVALLFAVSVVYGRMAGDNEVVAVKTAGLSAMTLLWPTLSLGLALAFGLAYASADVIPRANRQATDVIFRNLEDYVYKVLKKERAIDNPEWPFFIQVEDIQGRIMVRPTFKHRVPGSPDTFDMTVQAESAVIKFDTDHLKADIILENADTEGSTAENEIIVLIDGKQHIEYDLPPKFSSRLDRKIQEKTNAELALDEAGYLRKIRTERRRQALLAAFRIGMGQLGRVDPLAPGLLSNVESVDWASVGGTANQFNYWKLKLHELETERHFRVAIAFGTFFFVLLGSPVGILFARRDFLSAFMLCFVPIILLYYPLLLAFVNLGKEGVTWPPLVWSSNVVLGVLAGFLALPPILRH